MAKFKGQYTVGDGYANQKGRPHSFSIDENEIEDDEATDQYLLALYQEAAQFHFEQNILCEPDKEHEFVAWAREIIEKRKGEDPA